MVSWTHTLESYLHIGSKVIFPTTYFGPISWYRCWLNDTDALIEQYETFPKQTIRNRCQIMGSNGVQTLTIPVERQHGRQIKTCDLHITYQEKWQHQHWEALRSAYRNSPFYDYYAEFFEQLYTNHFDYLLDFNIKAMEIILKLLDSPKPIRLTSDYMGVSEITMNENTQPYYQVFQDKHGFQPDLSIVDLLFNMGPEAMMYI